MSGRESLSVTFTPSTGDYTGDFSSTISETCPCCNGRKVQTRNDGIVIICPCCGGKGVRYPDNWYITC